MFCKIADLITEVPDAGGLAPRCREYLCSEEISVDVIIRADLYRAERYGPSVTDETVAYMETAYQFYIELVKHGGLYLHSSAVTLENRAYLFSGPCGMGKSTHTRLWQQVFGEAAQVINDDKPALRKMDGTWYAYGTPWCGKDGINQNKRVPLAGICFLKQAQENRIRRINPEESLKKILSQTIFKFRDVAMLDQMLNSLDQLVREIPMFELENRPEPNAVQLSHNTMLSAAKEVGL